MLRAVHFVQTRPASGVTVSSIYVRADGNQLRDLASLLGDKQSEIPVAARYHSPMPPGH
jgi:hypothetical protein